MKELYYVYPMHQNGSFNFISKNHIRHLSENIRIQQIDEGTLDVIAWVTKKNVLLHPIGYMLLGDCMEQFPHRIKRLQRLKNTTKRLGGFDTADSNRISKIFVDVLNEMDLVMVPSSWARDTFIKSGVMAPVEVIPHGLNDALLSDSKEITNDAVQKLIEIKKKNNAILVLFFLAHSGYRKGADIVTQVMTRIQRERDDVFLVVKTLDVLDPYMSAFSGLKMIHIKGFFNDDELRQLYDACDICVVPSRGGGFELNALEAIARGLITLVPNGMCFTDYIDYTIPIKVKRSVKVLEGNPLHTGDGYEVDIDDFTEKMFKVIDDIKKYKRLFKRYSKAVRERYSWEKICDKLYETLERYDFV